MTILSIESWWSNMQTPEQIYWIIAIPFSIFFLIQLFMTLLGGDFDSTGTDGDADVSIDDDGGMGFQFISIKNLIGFFTLFGWTGLWAISSGFGVILSVIFAAIAGLIMMLIMASLVYYLGKLNEEGTLDINNSIGKIGTVYLRIPGDRKGMGKVQIKVQGFQTLDAITDDLEELPTGSVVEVIDIINNEVLLVSKSI